MRPSKIIFLLLVLFCTGTFVYSQNTAKQENRKAKLEKEIAIINNQLSELAGKSNKALSSLQLIRAQLSKRKALLEESEKELAAINSKIKEKQKEIDAIQANLDTMSFYYKKLVKNAYKNRDSRTWFMYILTSDNFGQALNRVSYLKSLSSRMNEQGKKIMAKKALLEEENVQLLEMKAEAAHIRKERAEEVRAIQKEEEKSNTLVKNLNREKTKYQKQLAAKKKEVDALNREIARIIRGVTTSSKKTEIDTALDAEFAKNKGKLPWPADGAVVDKFGQRNHPVYKGVKLPNNNGVNIALRQGSEVKAIFDGVVKQIVVMPGYNKCVLVQHGNYFSFYCKLGVVDVKSGDKIKTGQTIGIVDTIAGETILHLQIWKGTSPQNPELWLK